MPRCLDAIATDTVPSWPGESADRMRRRNRRRPNPRGRRDGERAPGLVFEHERPRPQLAAPLPSLDALMPRHFCLDYGFDGCIFGAGMREDRAITPVEA